MNHDKVVKVSYDSYNKGTYDSFMMKIGTEYKKTFGYHMISDDIDVTYKDIHGTEIPIKSSDDYGKFLSQTYIVEISQLSKGISIF